MDQEVLGADQEVLWAHQEVLGVDQEPFRTPSLLIFIQVTLATQQKAAAAPP